MEEQSELLVFPIRYQIKHIWCLLHFEHQYTNGLVSLLNNKRWYKEQGVFEPHIWYNCDIFTQYLKLWLALSE